MSTRLVPLLAAIAFAACAPRRPAAPSHRFELVTFAEPANPSDVEGEPCLFGSYVPGTPVLLLSDVDATTCSVTTGKVAIQWFGNGPCTILSGRERCRGRYPLGVIGSSGAYRPVPPRPITDEATRSGLGQIVSRGNAVDLARGRWKDELQGRSPRATIGDAIAWPDLDGRPVLVHLPLEPDGEGGPWVAASGGEVGAMAGPFSNDVPRGFILDGRSYLSVTVGGCTSCGGVGTEVHEVVGGRLRLVLESFANAN